jgi:hypothetical protein
MRFSELVAACGSIGRLPLTLTAASFIIAGCRSEPEVRLGRNGMHRELIVEAGVQLDDAGQPVLARPERLSTDSAGRIFITDFSDKNVKVYDRRGRRILTIGRPGRGPGEFQALLTAQAYGDSLAAYDFADARLSIFSADGRFVRSLSLSRREFPVPFYVRVVDDSLFLSIAALPGMPRRPLLALLRPDGSVVSTFFEQSKYVGSNPQVLQQIGPIADGSDGVVFAAFAGGDSVWAYDYRGRRLDSAPVDPVKPLVSSRTLIEGNGGRARRGDGSWVTNGNRALIGIVALDSGSVALQVAVHDSKNGTDPLDGGTVLVSSLVSRTELETIARLETTGGLLGRDRSGNPLLLRYASPDGDAYRVFRVRLATTGR